MNHGEQTPTGRILFQGAFLNKNKYLDALIKQKCEEDASVDYDKVWSNIISNEGSVQTVKCLSDYEKDIYKTSMEIDQRWVVEHAADRQQFIDQAQSVNLFFRPDANIKYLHAVHFLSMEDGFEESILLSFRKDRQS